MFQEGRELVATYPARPVPLWLQIGSYFLASLLGWHAGGTERQRDLHTFQSREGLMLVRGSWCLWCIDPQRRTRANGYEDSPKGEGLPRGPPISNREPAPSKMPRH